MTKNNEYIDNSRPVDIEEFINKFKCCNDKLDDDDVGTIETLFDSGYCYSFALILKHVFPSGELYLAWPCSHIVFGINGEYTKFDPKLPFSLKDFVSKYFERLRSINIIGVIYDNDDR